MAGNPPALAPPHPAQAQTAQDRDYAHAYQNRNSVPAPNANHPHAATPIGNATPREIQQHLEGRMHGWRDFTQGPHGNIQLNSLSPTQIAEHLDFRNMTTSDKRSHTSAEDRMGKDLTPAVGHDVGIYQNHHHEEEMHLPENFARIEHTGHRLREGGTDNCNCPKKDKDGNIYYQTRADPHTVMNFMRHMNEHYRETATSPNEPLPFPQIADWEAANVNVGGLHGQPIIGTRTVLQLTPQATLRRQPNWTTAEAVTKTVLNTITPKRNRDDDDN